MKKNLFAFFFLISMATFAQSKMIDRQAKAITNEMIKVLALEDEKYASLFEIHKLKFVEINDLRDNFSKQEFQSKRTAVFVNAQNKMKELIGNEKMRQWFAYQKQKQHNKSKL